MKRIVLVCCALMSCNLLFGQVTDDFSDGNYTSNPSWSGDSDKFVITDGQLNSLNSGSATYYLSTPSALATETEWELFINLKFSTSGANFIDIYLVSDQADLNTTANGYFVRVGNTADEISLYKKEAGTETILIDGSDGLVNSSSNNPFNIRVKRDNNSLWVLEIDDGATRNYETEGTAVDNSINTSTHFGIKIKQSTAASSINYHFFDNISVKAIVADTQPPTLISAEAISLFAIDLKFDEPLYQSSAQTLVNYTMDKGVGIPISITLDLVSLSTVRLVFGSPLVNNETYQIEVKNISDLNDNSLLTQVLSFEVLIPEIAEAEDIVITEIMADPTPPQRLPEAEYVELYNKSDKYIDLAGFSLTGANITSEKRIISPDQYFVLCDEDDQMLFESYGQVIGVNGWNSLTNTGETVVLKNPSDEIIDQVSYNDSWYQSADKKDGGWSLELIDPQNECGEETNWAASIDDNGGTIGIENSVLANKPDLTRPQLLSVFAIDERTVVLKFNERLDEETFDMAGFSIEPALEISQTNLSGNAREITIVLDNPLQLRTNYTLIVSNIKDCNGNIIVDENQGVFGLSEEAEAGDVLINELLYNPITSRGDFLEIYNNSEKYINLKKWSIASGGEGKPDKIEPITLGHLIVKPFEYILLTEEPLAVGSDYPKAQINNFFEVGGLPSFPNDGQEVFIMDSMNIVLDHFPYQDEMQHELLDDTKGVSLERLSFDSPTDDPNNWHSAARSVGFATPGYVNSQAIGESLSQSSAVSISPKVFLPNQSGMDDFTMINYVFDRPGFIATVSIIDINGRKIKTIVSNQLLAVEGFFQWNGTMSNGSKARSGAYIVHFEVFDSSGDIKIYQKRVVIAPEL